MSFVSISLGDLRSTPCRSKIMFPLSVIKSLDLHGVDLRSPKEIETKLNLIPGVVDNGIFAHHVPRYIVVGNSEGYELIES